MEEIRFNPDIILINERENDTGEMILNRILGYTEQRVNQFEMYPKYVVISEEDLEKVRNFNPTVIIDNKILGLEIRLFRKSKKREWRKRNVYNNF